MKNSAWKILDIFSWLMVLELRNPFSRQIYVYFHIVMFFYFHIVMFFFIKESFLRMFKIFECRNMPK